MILQTDEIKTEDSVDFNKTGTSDDIKKTILSRQGARPTANHIEFNVPLEE